jgi:lipid-binding SYLF domain-containing protein
MSALTRSAVQTLIDNEYTEFGTDVTVQLWPGAEHGPNDQVSISSSDWVTASCSTGIIFDFSLSGGSIKVDDEKNHEVYGSEATGDDILHGKVDRPGEMVPLYQKLTEISKKTFD